jgi:hypothetical protein
MGSAGFEVRGSSSRGEAHKSNPSARLAVVPSKVHASTFRSGLLAPCRMLRLCCAISTASMRGLPAKGWPRAF